MPRYRWIGASDTEIPDAKVVVREGDEFDSEVEINHPHAVRLDEPKKSAKKAEE